MRPTRALTALLLPLALLVAACSSSKSPATSSNAGTKNSISNGGANASTGGGSSDKAATAKAPSPPAAPLTQSVATDDGNHYTVTVTPKAPDTNAVCATVNAPGHMIIPFTMTVKNDNGAKAPQPGLGFQLSDPGNNQPEVVAVSIPPVCVDFILTGEALEAGAVATYEGSIGNATPTTKLTVNVKNNAPGTPPSFDVPLFAGAK
jgi:hypothetical protein